jgi:hypothetical protein
VLSRAELLRRGARGGALLVASGTGVAVLAPSASAAVPDGDVAYLRLLVAAELLTADFASEALASGKLTGREAALVKQAQADDKAHYNGLSVLMNGAGQPPTLADDIDFSYPKQSYASQASILKLGWTLATLSLGAYLGAVENVQTPELRGPIGQIAANEAQHVAAFAQLLGRPVVGRPFAAALPIDAVSAALDRYES